MARDEEMEGWMRVLAFNGSRPMTEEEYKASGLREISSSSPIEPEYVFDDGRDPFEEMSDEVAFNGLIDGAGDFPLWEESDK